jgi:Ca-activated chloride channel family protein
MFRFEHPEYLYALAAIPLLVFFFFLTRMFRRQSIRRFGDSELVQQLMPDFSDFRQSLKFVLLLLGLTFLIVGWSNPQWGTKKERVKRRSVDVFIALDISQSMLAQDITPSRLERAKRFTQNLIEGLRGERIGSIIFAGNAYIQTPLTTDYAYATLLSRSANPDQAPTQGTAIADAIDLAEQSFEEENKNHKALVIITDGENHDEEALQRAGEARDNGLLIFTVGVGTAEGSFIPIRVGGREDYKRDRNGQPVRTSLNEDLLRELAQTGGGAYFNLDSGSKAVVNALQERIDGIEKREFEQRVFNEYESYFQYFIALALLFFLLEFLLPYRRSKYFADRDIFAT